MANKNINDSDWEEGSNSEGQSWRFLDLSGEHLGVRVEELPPGGTSSTHHYHTSEEEHILVLEGSATLILGNANKILQPGDHVCFLAGKEVAHHIENTTLEPFKFLVFGERNQQDVVIYPEKNTMMVKALGWKEFNCNPIVKSDDPESCT